MNATPNATPTRSDVLAVHAQHATRPRRGDRRRSRRRHGVGSTTFAELNAHGEPARATGCSPPARDRGERLVWCGPNSLEVLATIHAARKLNLVAVPLSYRFNAEEMAYVIDNSDATTVVVDAEQAPLVAAVRGRASRRCARSSSSAAPHPTGCRRWDDVLAGQPDTEPPTPADASEAGAAMIYTSGTTGKPKGALRTRTDRTDRVRAARRAEPAARERGAPHDRPAVPLRSARVRVAVAHARRADRRAAQVRRRRAGSTW